MNYRLVEIGKSVSKINTNSLRKILEATFTWLMTDIISAAEMSKISMNGIVRAKKQVLSPVSFARYLRDA